MTHPAEVVRRTPARARLRLPGTGRTTGVEESQSSIHAPNESVAPQEIADMALAEALFLQSYGAARG